MKKQLILSALSLLIFCLPLLSRADSIEWQSYKEGIAKGKSEKKKIFLNFYADW